MSVTAVLEHAPQPDDQESNGGDLSHTEKQKREHVTTRGIGSKEETSVNQNEHSMALNSNQA